MTDDSARPFKFPGGRKLFVVLVALFFALVVFAVLLLADKLDTAALEQVLEFCSTIVGIYLGASAGQIGLTKIGEGIAGGKAAQRSLVDAIDYRSNVVSGLGEDLDPAGEDEDLTG